MPPTPQLGASLLGEAAHNHAESLTARRQAQQQRVSVETQKTQETTNDPDTPSVVQRSGIGVLTSSLPAVHCQIMEARKDDREKQLTKRLKQQQEEHGESMDPQETQSFSEPSTKPKPKDVSSEEKEDVLSRSKLHSRSTIRMNTIIANIDPAEHDAANHSAKGKSKTTRWQFGIRSRNQPLDAMGCIYKALKAQGAQWECPPPTGEPKTEAHSGPYSVNIAGATHLTDPGLSESPEKEKRNFTDRYDGASNHDDRAAHDEHETMEMRRRSSEISNSDDDLQDVNDVPSGYFPKDPWHIHVRWLKEGMYPPGTLHPHSAHSSRMDLSDDVARRRGSVIGSMSSAAGSATSIVANLAASLAGNGPESACFVYMDVQLYQVEAGCYLVDFKCAGYEGAVEGTNPFTGKSELVGNGHRVLDKDVTSPQPFLDLTNQLVIHLAKG